MASLLAEQDIERVPAQRGSSQHQPEYSQRGGGNRGGPQGPPMPASQRALQEEHSLAVAPSRQPQPQPPRRQPPPQPPPQPPLQPPHEAFAMQEIRRAQAALDAEEGRLLAELAELRRGREQPSPSPPPQQQHIQQQQQPYAQRSSQPVALMSPARAYDLERRGEASACQQQQLERQRQLEVRTAHKSPQERKEARIVDWIQGGNPWAEQGFVPMSEAQGQREYVPSSQRVPGGGVGAPPSATSSALAAGRLQRSDSRRALSRRTPPGAGAAPSRLGDPGVMAFMA